MRWWLAVLALFHISCTQPAPSPPVAEAQSPAPAPPSAAAAPADNRPVIVAFGDSLTFGPAVGPDQNYPAVLQRKLDAAGYRYRIVNLGINGDTTLGGLNRLEDVLARQPRIVILELGANDGLRGMPVEATRSNLDQIIRRLQEAGVQVILAGMTLPPNYGAAYVKEFEKVFVDLSRKYKTPRIPFFLQDVATNAALMLGDNLHPNAAGYEVVASHVYKVLHPLL